MRETARAVSVYQSTAEVPRGFGPCVAAIGNFDGVHVGHQENLAAVVREARERNVRSLAITFDPHPDRFLRPLRAPLLLTSMEQRIRLLADTGVDAVLVLPFGDELASLTAEQFVREILVGGLKVCALHEGGNFHFGHRAAAGVDELRAFGATLGFAVQVHEPVHVHGLEVSTPRSGHCLRRATCGGLAGCWDARSRCNQRRRADAASGRACWCPRSTWRSTGKCFRPLACM